MKDARNEPNGTLDDGWVEGSGGGWGADGRTGERSRQTAKGTGLTCITYLKTGAWAASHEGKNEQNQ